MVNISLTSVKISIKLCTRHVEYFHDMKKHSHKNTVSVKIV